MTIGLKVDFLWYPLGTSDFVFSFFSTIAIRLEKGKWGSLFPAIMNNLYSGALPVDLAPNAIEEIKTIRKMLEKLPVDQIIWNAEDLSLAPPWGDDISKDIKNLSEYFVTTDGKNLISVLETSLKEAVLENVEVKLTHL